MNISLRYATPKDAVLIADISRQTFYDTFAPDNAKEDMDKFMSEQFTRGRLIMEVGAPGNTFLLAYAGNAVAGYVKLRTGKEPDELKAFSSIEIARLYVLKDFIGHGIGAKLMQASIDIAMEQGRQVIWLGVWEKNRRAIDFYTRWGFQKFGEWDFQLGDDLQRDWMMKKDLTANQSSANHSLKQL
jgi:ribosomal protein S18 acetylase RimI-like enzyme